MSFLARTGFEQAGFRRRTLSVVSVLAVVLLPLVVGGTVAWSYGQRLDHVDAVKFALVNADDPVTRTINGKKTTIPGGRLVATALTQPKTHDSSDPTWVLTDADHAAAGLDDGTYAAVATIPKTFSDAITSTATDSPYQATVSLVADESQSLLTARMARTSLTNATTAVGRSLTRSYVSTVLVAFNTMATSTKKTADGTAKLDDGAQKLSDGLAKTASGAAKLSDGLDQLSDGAAQASDGLNQLAAGTPKLAAGATTLATGLTKLGKGATRVDTSAKKLAAGARSIDSGTLALAQGGDDLVHGTSAYVTGIHQLSQGAADLTDGTSDLKDGLAKDATGLDQLAASCTQVTTVASFCESLSQAAAGTQKLADGAASLEDGAQEYSVGVSKAAAGGDDLLTGTKKYAAGVHSLRKGTKKYASGMTKFQREGTHAIATGTRQSAAGATTFASHIADVDSGVRRLAAGIAQLSGGLVSTSTGSAQLADGTDQLASGSKKLSNGTHTLAKGFADAKDDVPSYTKDERDQIATTVTRPVTTSPVAVDAPSTGAAVASAAVLPAVLWWGAFAAFLVLPAIPRRVELSAVSPWRATLLGWWPATAVGVAQGLLLGLTVPLLGLDPAHPWALGAVALLATVVFTALNQALTVAFGGLGRVLSLAWLGFQAAVLGGFVPLAGAPAVLRAVSSVSPLSQAAGLLQTMLLGGDTSQVFSRIAGLVLWAIVAVLVTVWGVGHARRARARRDLTVVETGGAPSAALVPAG